MTMVSVSPARSASRAITSDSKALSRSRRLTTATLMSGDAGKQGRIELPFILKRGGARHQDMVVAFAPFDAEFAAGPALSAPCDWRA